MPKQSKSMTRPQRRRRPATLAFVPIRGTEYAGVVNSAVAGAVTNYNISPRLAASLFPRVSTIAENWSQYRFRSLSFRLVGRSSPNITANASMSFLPYIGGGTPSLTTEYEVKATAGSKTIAAHKSGSLRVAPPSTWLSTDTDAGTVFVNTMIGRLYLYLSPTSVAGEAQWDLYVSYSLQFRGQTPASVIN